MASRLLQVAPMGSRSGLVAVSKGGVSLTLAILPKVWRTGRVDGDRGRNTILLTQGGAYAIHELDFVEFGESVVDLAASLLDLSDGVESRAEGEMGSEQARNSRLFEEVRRTPRLPPHSDGVLHRQNARHLESLFALALLADRTRRPGGEAAGIETLEVADATGNGLSTGQDSNPVLEVLRAWEFVRELERRIRELRRGYVVAQDFSSVLRGRVLDSGIANWLATGEPRMDCEFDDFSEVSPLFQVIVTALDQLASRTANGWGSLTRWSLCREIARDAGNLRRSLGTIQSLSRAQAAELAQRIRLPRAMRSWQQALESCRHILSALPSSLSTSADAQDQGLAWWVDTPRLWELVLHDALSQVRPLHAGDLFSKWMSSGAPKTPAPWTRSAGENRAMDRQPDIVWTSPCGTRFFIGDAKYKEYTRTPAVGDMYQLFAYSHLTTFEQAKPGMATARAPTCTLIYPGAFERQSWKRAPGHESVELVSQSVPFPSYEHVSSDAIWRQYLRDTGRAICDAVAGGAK